MRYFARTMGVLGLSFLAVATVQTATCPSASAALAKSQPDNAVLNRALHAWASFPVRSSSRPIILIEGYVLNPQYGFADDNSKTAFENGQVIVPASWPVSPTSSMGFPIIGASAAFKTLTIPTPCSGCPPVAPLSTTGVQLGSGLFLTDRGYRNLPAWLFSLSGVQNPATVLAVGPSAIYSAPVTHDGVSPAQMSATIGAGGKRIVVNFPGAAAGTGPCTASYTLSFKESKQAVAIAVIARPHGGADVICATQATERHAAAELKAPLGARVVVDAQNDGAASATPAPSGRAKDS